MKTEQLPMIWFGIAGTIYAIGLIVFAATVSSSFLMGFAAGGALILATFLFGTRKLKKIDLSRRGAVTASVMSGFYLRLAVVGICLYGLITIVQVDPVGLVVGLSVLPTGLLVLPALILLANRRPKEVS